MKESKAVINDTVKNENDVVKESTKEVGNLKTALTASEMDAVTTVFRSYETGLREATILGRDLHAAMKMLGLNPLEQEIIDLTNNIVKDGFIYFPEFCKVIQKKFREDDEELFKQNMFKVSFDILSMKSCLMKIFDGTAILY